MRSWENLFEKRFSHTLSKNIPNKIYLNRFVGLQTDSRREVQALAWLPASLR